MRAGLDLQRAAEHRARLVARQARHRTAERFDDLSATVTQGAGKVRNHLQQTRWGDSLLQMPSQGMQQDSRGARSAA